MRVVIFLANEVRAFEPTAAQVTGLAQRLANHTLVAVPTEADFRKELTTADAVVVWRFLPEWYQAAPRLRRICTPSAGRERIAPAPFAHVTRHFGAFHGAIMAESLLAMMLFMNRRLGNAMRAQQAQRWDPLAHDGAQPLSGQAALLVGYGAIGKQAARLLSTMGMRVFGLKRDLNRGAEPIPGTKRRSYLEQNVVSAELILTAQELEQISQAAPKGSAVGNRYADMSSVNR